MHIDMHAYINTHMYTLTGNACIYTYSHTYMHTDKHTHLSAYMCTHIRVRDLTHIRVRDLCHGWCICEKGRNGIFVFVCKHVYNNNGVYACVRTCL